MNIFQLYVNILGVPIHVLGMLLVFIAILIGVLLQGKKYPFHIKLMNSMALITLGHFVYEDMFIVIMGVVGRSMDAIFLYLIITASLVICIMILHNYRPFVRTRLWWLCVFNVLLFQCMIFLVMFKRGWFYDLQLWYEGMGPDPHNLLWAISKAWGFLGWVMLIRRGKDV